MLMCSLEVAMVLSWSKSCSRNFKYPTMPIIAALSVVYSNFGIYVAHPAESSMARSVDRISEFAETPPAIATCLIPVCSEASCSRFINMFTMVCWIEAQRSAILSRIKFGLFFCSLCRKYKIAVFNPLKLKSRGFSVFGSEKLKAFRSPSLAYLSINGPPG